MTDRDERVEEDELDLDAETVADLDPKEDAEKVRGGYLVRGGTTSLCTTCPDPPTSVSISCCPLNIKP
jgi:hypothetical protein